MRKIASPQDLQAELRQLLAYTQEERPSRRVVAAKLQALASRILVAKKTTYLHYNEDDLISYEYSPASAASHIYYDGDGVSLRVDEREQDYVEIDSPSLFKEAEEWLEKVMKKYPPTTVPEEAKTELHSLLKKLRADNT